jgi:hypothetical protein
MTIEQLRELIERLQADATQVTSDELTQARAFIRDQRKHLAEQPASDDVIAGLEELAGSFKTVKETVDARAAESAKLEETRKGLLADLDDDETTAADTSTGTEGDQPADGDPVPDADQQPPAVTTPDTGVPTTPPGPPTPVGDPTSDAGVQGETTLPIAAGGNVPARRAPIGTFRSGAQNLPAPRVTETIRTNTTAAGGSPGFVQGQKIGSTAELALAVTAQLRAMSSGRGGSGEKVYVANTTIEYPESRQLRVKDWAGNFTKIEAVTGDQALVAAGGLCAPPQTLYDVQVIGSVRRPIRDALARFQVDRGAIQFRPNSSAATALTTGTGTGVDTWTNAQDASSAGDTKGCYVVDCPALTEAEIQAIYLCLEFSNVTARFDPETTAANIQQGMIAHARKAENELLRQLQAGSKVLTGAKVVGATRDILVYLDRAVAYYRNRHRIDTNVTLTFLLPAWVMYMMRSDLARQMAAGDWASALSVSDAMIMQWFGERGVNPVFHLDGGIGGVNEVQTLTVTGTPTGGSYTLTFSGQTTAAIPYNAAAADVRTALEALSNVRVGEVAVAGGPHPGTAITVAFGGDYEHTDVAQMTATGSFTGGSSPAIAVTTTTTSSLTSVVNGVSIASQVYANAAAGAAIPVYPAQIDSLLFVTGTKLFLDGGNLDLGLVRDSTLNARNRYRQFSETFEGVADRGIENLRLVLSVLPTGAATGTVDPSTISA